MERARRLHKSSEDKMLFGVAGGVSEYSGIDPALVRVAWVALAFLTGGAAALVYIVMAFVMPDPRVPRTPSEYDLAGDDMADDRAADHETVGEVRTAKRHIARNVVGGGLILVGLIVLLANLGVINDIRWDVIWPVVVIALGLTILIPSLRR